MSRGSKRTARWIGTAPKSGSSSVFGFILTTGHRGCSSSASRHTGRSHRRQAGTESGASARSDRQARAASTFRSIRGTEHDDVDVTLLRPPRRVRRHGPVFPEPDEREAVQRGALFHQEAAHHFLAPPARVHVGADRPASSVWPTTSAGGARAAGLEDQPHAKVTARSNYLSRMSSQASGVTAALSFSRRTTVVVEDSKIAGPLTSSPARTRSMSYTGTSSHRPMNTRRLFGCASPPAATGRSAGRLGSRPMTATRALTSTTSLPGAL